VTVLVTGAGGFLGAAVVRRLLAGNHRTLALVRPCGKEPAAHDSLSVLRGDLRQKGAWVGQVQSPEAVLHLAAGTSGDLPEQFASSVIATENLLTALDPKRLRRFVHVSTFSVYDYSRIGRGALLDENSPLEDWPEERDAYTWTKILQERMVGDWCGQHGVELTVIRPGAIYGPGKTWDFGAALDVGRVSLLFAPWSRMRLTHVDNCAEAIVLALETAGASGATLNIVDDDLPTHSGFRRLARRAGAKLPRAVYVPWLFVAAAGLMLRTINRRLLGNRARLPEFLHYRRQQARWKPLRYRNARAKALLGWSPRVSINQGVQQMVEALPASSRMAAPRSLASASAVEAA
jgi:2-alkyl-3-oxoalkanoate reductase